MAKWKKPRMKGQARRKSPTKEDFEEDDRLMRIVHQRYNMRGWVHQMDFQDLHREFNEGKITTAEFAHKMGERIENEPWYKHEKKLPNGAFTLEDYVSMLKGFKARSPRFEEKDQEKFDGLMSSIYDYGDNLKIWIHL